MRNINPIIKYTAMLSLVALVAVGVLFAARQPKSDGRISKGTITNGGVSGEASEGVRDRENDLYVVEELDTTKDSLTVVSLQTGNRLRFDFDSSTEFFNRYGEYETWSKFVPGTVVTLGTVKSDSTVKKVSIHDGGFRFDGISDFSIDTIGGFITFGKEKLVLPDIYAVLSQDGIISAEDIKGGDTLSVIGEGRNVYCLIVTGSSGTLKLTNTDKFDGSVVEIGDSIFAQVERNAEISVPEGTYTVTAANGGYGGSTEVTIDPGKTTTLDMTELEGEGPKTCRLSFRVANTSCKIYLDGRQVDNFTTEKVTYGTHKLVITADGYDTWKKYLVVNSESASIEIDLDESESSSAASSSTAASDAEADEGAATGGSNTITGSLSGSSNSTAGSANSTAGSTNSSSGTASNSTTGTSSTGSAAGSSSSNTDTELEYYSTLSNLISSLLD